MERDSAAQRLEAAKNLAFSPEMLEFCDVQHRFVDHGEAHRDALVAVARVLAREARRRRLLPETILFAMRIAGCYRAGDLYPQAMEQSSRCTSALNALLHAYHGSESRPSERRSIERKERSSNPSQTE